MLLDWEEVRRGDLVFLSGSYHTVIRVKKYELIGPPPGPIFFWAVCCIDNATGTMDRRVIKTFEEAAVVVDRM